MSAVEDFVQCARNQIGKPYVWATAGPDTFDCSGLVAYCWEQTQGEPMTRSSVQQYLLGEYVPPGERVQAGDLAFWDTFGEAPGHVAIVDTDATIIHALNETRGVIRSENISVNMGGRNRFMGVRRLFTADHPDAPDPLPDTEPPKAHRRRTRRRRIR